MVLDDQYADLYNNCDPKSPIGENCPLRYSVLSHACILQSLSKYKWALVYCADLQI